MKIHEKYIWRINEAKKNKENYKNLFKAKQKKYHKFIENLNENKPKKKIKETLKTRNYYLQCMYTY